MVEHLPWATVVILGSSPHHIRLAAQQGVCFSLSFCSFSLSNKILKKKKVQNDAKINWLFHNGKKNENFTFIPMFFHKDLSRL